MALLCHDFTLRYITMGIINLTAFYRDLPEKETKFCIEYMPGQRSAAVPRRYRAHCFKNLRMTYKVKLESIAESNNGFCIAVWRRVAGKPGRSVSLFYDSGRRVRSSCRSARLPRILAGKDEGRD